MKQNRTRLKKMLAVGVELIGILPMKIQGRCCPFVLEIENKIFLANEVPTLPLSECNAKCGCIYYAAQKKSTDAEKQKNSEELKQRGFSINIKRG
jgi:hypothetical protein